MTVPAKGARLSELPHCSAAGHNRRLWQNTALLRGVVRPSPSVSPSVVCLNLQVSPCAMCLSLQLYCGLVCLSLSVYPGVRCLISAIVTRSDVPGSDSVPSEPSRAPVICGTLPSDTTLAADCFRPVPGLPTPAGTSSRPEPALSCACSHQAPVCPAATPLTGGGDSAPRQPAEATTPEPACDGHRVLSGEDGPLVADPPEGARVPAALPPPGRPRAIRVGLSKRAQLRPLHVRRPR